MNKLNSKLTYVNNINSANIITENCLYRGSILGVFNNNKTISNKHTNFFYPKFSKSIVNKTLNRYIDYYFIFNTKLNEQELKLISFLISQDRSVILVNCKFNLSELKKHIKEEDITTYNNINIKETLENF